MMCDSTEIIMVISVSLRTVVYKYIFLNPLLDKYNNTVYAWTRNIHVYFKNNFGEWRNSLKN